MRITKIISSVLVFTFLFNCGGSSGGGSSSSSDAASNEVMTLQELLDQGIAVSDEEIPDILAGEWSITSYDLGATSEVIEADEEAPTIVFPESNSVSLGQFLTDGILFNVVAAGELVDFSAEPLYNYEGSTVPELGIGALDGGKTEGEDDGYYVNFYWCTEVIDECECGNFDDYCVVYTPKPNTSNDLTYTYGTIGSPNNSDSNINGLYDYSMDYEIVQDATTSKYFMSFYLHGKDYNDCSFTGTGSHKSNECYETYGEAYLADYEEKTTETTYAVESLNSAYIAIETDDSFVVLKKNDLLTQ